MPIRSVRRAPYKAKVSGADTTSGYLSEELVAGSGITLTVTNPGADEKVSIASSVVDTDVKVKASSADTTADFLTNKISAGYGVTKTILNPAGNEQVKLAVGSVLATLTSSAGAATMDCSLADIFILTLTENTTLTPTNTATGKTYMLKVAQDGTGGWTLAFAAAVKFPGGTDPVITPAASSVDVLSFLSVDGTTLYGVFSQDLQ